MWTLNHSHKTLLMLLLSVVWISNCLAQSIQGNPNINSSSAVQWIEDEIIVKFKPGCPSAEIQRIHTDMGVKPIAVGQDKNVRLLRIPQGIAIDKMLSAYSKNPHVQYAEKNYIAHAHVSPNDTLYSEQWNFAQIDMESAWDIQTGISSVIVAVLDSGVAYEDNQEFVDNPGRGRDYWATYQQAPDLAGTNFVAGYDFINDDEHPNDDNSHGTHVTGTIAQTTNNNLGVAGIAYNCSIMPVKVLDSNGSGSYLAIADGIIWATDNGADVINMSLGGPSTLQVLEDAVSYAHSKGVTIVASTGNDAGAVGYPAAYANVIAVGSIHSGGELASYSNFGDPIDLVAPGGDGVDRDGDTYPDGILQNTFNPNTKNTTDFNYWFFSGTSMAAPHVSGLAALIISNGINDPDLVRQAMQETAVDIGDESWDIFYGWGLIDPYAALNWEPSDPPTPVPPIASFSADPLNGTEPLTVTFSDSSTGDITSWSWDFGDGSPVNDTQNPPEHTYTVPGSYSVSLTVSGEGGSDTMTKTNYITVEDSTIPPIQTPIRTELLLSAGPDPRSAGRNVYVYAEATITVFEQDSSGLGLWTKVVSDVSVEGHWSVSAIDTDFDYTDADGQVIFDSDETKTKSGNSVTFTFTIDSVAHDDYLWDEEGSMKEATKTFTATAG